MAKLLVNQTEVQAKHGLMMIISFFVLFTVNSLVLILANSFFPTHVVLGSYAVPYWWAIHHTMFKLAVIGTFAMTLVTYYEWKNKLTFSPKQWMLTYFVVNFVVLWGITRFAEFMGLGVTSWFVVVLLAAAMDWAQGLAMMTLGKVVKL